MENPKKMRADKLARMLNDIYRIEKVPFYVRGDSAGNFVCVDSEDILLGYIDVGKGNLRAI